MKAYIKIILGTSILAVAGCTSLSEGQENLPPGPAVEQRVRYRGNAQADLRERMDQEASEINRKRNIEQFDRNKAAMTPPDLRPQQLPFSPIDSTRHNIYWPIRPVIRPIQVKQD
ncbi:hypothetical protein ACSX1A_00480 [Pontibacter sp. MBLB2868]|uniref:hypothetical protein n=1 Tax=Pontibacter sp. MBLB2868 TaxID=3451555 RepID=UPI003F753B1F